mmetsp:Transcript_28330/g.59759  ORF Transcript_28330/g.59759 Transcript_28330/m.59759 type:complete len:132 (-) Transcript_28330:475-870(-)
MSSDSWMREYSEVKASCDEVYELIRERNAMTSSSSSSLGMTMSQQTGQEVHKLSAQCRRKLTSLNNKINELDKSVGQEKGGQVTQREQNRRTELVNALRVRKDQLKELMAKDNSRNERTKLLETQGNTQWQ